MKVKYNNLSTKHDGYEYHWTPKNNNIKKGKDQDIEDKKHYICEYEYT